MLPFFAWRHKACGNARISICCRPRTGEICRACFVWLRAVRRELNGKNLYESGKEKIENIMLDEWSGLADLLANLIEKYAADLDIADIPDTKLGMENKVELLGERMEFCIASSIAMRYRNRDNTVQTKAENMKERQRRIHMDNQKRIGKDKEGVIFPVALNLSEIGDSYLEFYRRN